MSDEQTRRRWINLGELIALAALIVSAAGVWITWKNSNQDKTTHVVEQRFAVPLALRSASESDGRTLTIVPADPSHALESLSLTIKGGAPIQVGSDGKLSSSDVESALKERPKENKDVAYGVPVRIDAHYIEAGTDRHGGGTYMLRYKWEGGGLFGSRSVHLLSLSKG